MDWRQLDRAAMHFGMLCRGRRRDVFHCIVSVPLVTSQRTLTTTPETTGTAAGWSQAAHTLTRATMLINTAGQHCAENVNPQKQPLAVRGTGRDSILKVVGLTLHTRADTKARKPERRKNDIKRYFRTKNLTFLCVRHKFSNVLRLKAAT